jgi:hypothetical protein
MWALADPKEKAFARDGLVMHETQSGLGRELALSRVQSKLLAVTLRQHGKDAPWFRASFPSMTSIL